MKRPASGATRTDQRFRAALARAEATPSDEAVAALRQAALPLIDQLHAAYVAAGSPHGADHRGLLRWLREVITQRDAESR
jgi:hypothetical protein